MIRESPPPQLLWGTHSSASRAESHSLRGLQLAMPLVQTPGRKLSNLRGAKLCARQDTAATKRLSSKTPGRGCLVTGLGAHSIFAVCHLLCLFHDFWGLYSLPSLWRSQGCPNSSLTPHLPSSLCPGESFSCIFPQSVVPEQRSDLDRKHNAPF